MATNYSSLSTKLSDLQAQAVKDGLKYAALREQQSGRNLQGIRTGAILGGYKDISVPAVTDYLEAGDTRFGQTINLDHAKQTFTLSQDTSFTFSSEQGKWNVGQLQEILTNQNADKLQATALAMKVNRIYQDLKDVVQGHSTKNGQRRLNQFLASLEAL